MPGLPGSQRSELKVEVDYLWPEVTLSTPCWLLWLCDLSGAACIFYEATRPWRNRGTKCTFRAVINLECFVNMADLKNTLQSRQLLQRKHTEARRLPRWHFLPDCWTTSATSTMSIEPVRQQRNLSFHMLIYLAPIFFSVLPGASMLKGWFTGSHYAVRFLSGIPAGWWLSVG